MGIKEFIMMNSGINRVIESIALPRWLHMHAADSKCDTIPFGTIYSIII